MLKIAMLGAGSLGFTRKLVADTLAVEELREVEFAFHDIDDLGLERVTNLCRKFVRENDLPARIEPYRERKKALEGADYAISMIRVGGLDAFAKDIEVPLKYGVDQCVGDTLGPGGIFYALRTIPVLLEFCKDMREVCPGVLFMNYSNPMAMNTWACLREGGVDFLGLCHGIQFDSQMIARALGVPAGELDYTAAGINHQAWFLELRHRGTDLTPKLPEALKKDAEHCAREPVRMDILEKFGYWSTETNGHLSEYLPWYRKTRELARSYEGKGAGWSGGETGGYLRACRNNWGRFDENYEKMLADPGHMKLVPRTIEHASYIIEAIETGRPYKGCFNVLNTGLITNLPEGCVVEVPCWVDGLGVRPVFVGELPKQCAAPLKWSVTAQEMAVEAAITGDRYLARMAVLHDPLTAAILTTDKAFELADEMFEAHKDWLPQFKV